MKLKEVYIKSLFNKDDVLINLSNLCNIIIGANGIGKSTILNIISNLLSGDLTKVAAYYFDEISIVYEDGEEYAASFSYEDLFPPIAYYLACYESYLELKEKEKDIFTKIDESQYFKVKDKEFYIDALKQALIELQSENLLGCFFYNLYVGNFQVYEAKNIIEKYNLNYEELEKVGFLEKSNMFYYGTVFKESGIEKQYEGNSNFCWLQSITLKDHLLMNMVEKYTVSNVPVYESIYHDSVAEWILQKPKGANVDIGYERFHKYGKEITKESWKCSAAGRKTKEVATTFCDDKKLNINELINALYFSDDFVIDINNIGQNYARECDQRIVEKWDYNQTDYNKLKEEFENAVSKVTDEVKRDYLNYLKPILVRNSYFDVDINEITKDSSFSGLDMACREYAVGSKKIEYLLSFMEEVLPLLKDSANRNSSVSVFERVVQEYFGDKIVLVMPSGIHIFYEDKDGKNRTLDLSVVSSGEKKLLILFSLSILLKDWVLILDEPELSLSIVWQSSLVPDLLRYGEQSSIIVATHSPYTVDDEEVQPYITYLPQGL